MRMAPTTVKPAISLSSAQGATACILTSESTALWKRDTREMMLCCDAQGRASGLEEDIGVSPSLAGRDGDVSVQAVVGGENQSA